MSVSVSSIDRWQREHPEFRRAIKRGKDEYDARNVEARLLDRCLGYEYEVVREQTLPNGTKRVTVTRKHMPPDVTACIFWLTNRNPERWKRIKETHFHGEVVHGHLHAHGGAVEIRDSAADVAEVARILREAGALDGVIEEIKDVDEG